MSESWLITGFSCFFFSLLAVSLGDEGQPSVRSGNTSQWRWSLVQSTFHCSLCLSSDTWRELSLRSPSPRVGLTSVKCQSQDTQMLSSSPRRSSMQGIARVLCYVLINHSSTGWLDLVCMECVTSLVSEEQLLVFLENVTWMLSH